MLKEKEGIVPALVLTFFCIVTALLLAFTNNLTKGRIVEAETKAATENMKKVTPLADSFKKLDDKTISEISAKYEGITQVYEAQKDGMNIGYVFQVESKGYGGMLPLMVSIKDDKTISGVAVMTNNETPGLGKKVENPDFTDQFTGKSSEKEFVLKNPDANQQQLDFISGATISSNSVKNSINKVISAFKEINKGGGK